MYFAHIFGKSHLKTKKSFLNFKSVKKNPLTGQERKYYWSSSLLNKEPSETLRATFPTINCKLSLLTRASQPGAR